MTHEYNDYKMNIRNIIEWNVRVEDKMKTRLSVKKGLIRTIRIYPVLLLLVAMMAAPTIHSNAAATIAKRRFNVSFKQTVTTKVLGTKKKITVKKGTKAVANGHGSTVVCTLSKNKQVKVSVKKLHYNGLKTTKKTYSRSVKENYVNKKGYSSKTKYLIWINQTTCNTTIFKGSKGKWKMVRSMKCVVGKGSSAGGFTTTGTFKLCRRDRAYGMPRIYFTWNKSKGWGNSFHRRINSVSWGAASHGCVRLGDADLTYLAGHCALGTTVVSN